MDLFLVVCSFSFCFSEYVFCFSCFVSSCMFIFFLLAQKENEPKEKGPGAVPELKFYAAVLNGQNSRHVVSLKHRPFLTPLRAKFLDALPLIAGRALRGGARPLFPPLPFSFFIFSFCFYVESTDGLFVFFISFFFFRKWLCILLICFGCLLIFLFVKKMKFFFIKLRF